MRKGYCRDLPEPQGYCNHQGRKFLPGRGLTITGYAEHHLRDKREASDHSFFSGFLSQFLLLCTSEANIHNAQIIQCATLRWYGHKCLQRERTGAWDELTSLGMVFLLSLINKEQENSWSHYQVRQMCTCEKHQTKKYNGTAH